MPDPNHLAKLFLGLIPADVRKGISAEETSDRLVEARKMSARAHDPLLSPDLREAARLRMTAVLQAPPRDVTRLEELRQAHGGRVPVGKAKKADEEPPVPVFDADGNLIGVVEADEIMPVAGAGKKTADAPSAAAPDVPADQAAAPAAGPAAAAAAQPVAKGPWRTTVVVYDQRGRACLTDQGSIRTSAPGAIRKAAGGDLVTVTDPSGRTYEVSRSVLQSPEVQARNTGPVGLGGTTGMGQPRMTGPAASLPFDGPQRARPGDVPGRQVVKAGSAGPGPVRTVGDAARDRRLARIEKAIGLDLRRPHVYARNPFSAEGHCVCEAPAVHRTHTEIAGGVPVDRRRVAKSSWSPGMANRATEQWLAAQAQRRR